MTQGNRTSWGAALGLILAAIAFAVSITLFAEAQAGPAITADFAVPASEQD